MFDETEEDICFIISSAKDIFKGRGLSIFDLLVVWKYMQISI